VDSTRLLFIRHAEPQEDMRNRIYGRLDVALSAAGHDHAARIAEMLGGLPTSIIYTSPLRRAAETAAPLAAVLGLEPLVLDDLREIDFGELEGLALDEVADRYPTEVSWTEAPSTVSFPGGESMASLRERSLRTAREIVERHRGETVVVISHAVVIRTILADCLNMHLDAMFRVDQRYGGISLVEWFGELPLVRVVNADRLDGLV
jgi:broad specificity phosphatase PhoE